MKVSTLIIQIALAIVLLTALASCAPNATSQYNVKVRNKQIANKMKSVRKNAHRDATRCPQKVTFDLPMFYTYNRR